MGRIGADGRGDVCPVDAVVAADADPAVADRAVRAGWDFHFRMVRIDPCRIDFHIDDFSSADRRRRVRLAWSDRVHADAHVSLIERQEAAGKVDFYALVFKGRLLLSFLFGRFCLGLCLGRRDFDLDRRFFSGAAFTVSAAGALDVIVTMGAGACFPLLDAGVLASIPMTGESAITIDAARMIFFSNAISPFYENPSRV